MANKDSIISVRVENKDYDNLRRISVETGISLSDLVRDAIARYNAPKPAFPVMPNTNGFGTSTNTSIMLNYSA